MVEINTTEYKINFWWTKYIVWPDEQGYIYKYFKNDWKFKTYPIEEQNNIIEKKKKYIWRFMPETELIKTEGDSYCIKQKYIEWKLLKSTDINQLDEQTLSELLELIDWYISYCKNEWKEIDTIWCQHDIYGFENVRKRRFFVYSRFLKGFLSSTNIIISNKNKVYMVDVCDIIPPDDISKIDKIKQTVKQAICKLWAKISKQKVSRLLKEKRKDLYKTLSK